MYANNRINYDPMFVLSLVCTTSLSYLCLCRRIGRYWPSKMPVKYILASVCLISSQFSQLSFVVRIYGFYLIIIIKSEIWPICHCLGLGHETMPYAVCLSIFFCNMKSPIALNTLAYAPVLNPLTKCSEDMNIAPTKYREVIFAL